ncbi:hypothetical protein THOM_2253 [Trachipleistophora hominis]|uniref:Uncharacterized protein n=1 Tax=Trachipleistophora hominis TaxID=72359 RepID=L7JU36_TRAHO|nr:hypothetical protein THOM_2253 [Trachipleistophora hominis]
MINVYYTLSIILYVALVLTGVLNQESEIKNDPSRKNQVLIPQQQRIVCNTFYARCDRNGIKEDNSSNDRTLCCENTDAKRNASLGSYNDALNSNGNEEDNGSDEVSLVPVKNVEDMDRKKKKKVRFDIPEKKM